MTQILTRLQRTGLCHTCKHAPTCLYLDRATKTVSHCEEFDDGSNDSTSQTEGALASFSPPDSPPARGLCGNCDHQARCLLPRAVGGVWFCEEYA